MKALVIAFLLLAGPVQAGGLSDLIMAPGVLASAPEGEVLRYGHERKLPARAEGEELPGAGRDFALPKPVAGGEAVLTSVAHADGPWLVLTLREAGKSHEVARFPASGPNPILLFFLENVVRNAAVQTGGSPYYIRNRIREALMAAGPGAGPDGRSTVTLHPFAGDRNRARMGVFADLALTIGFDPDDPGRLLSLMADTGAGSGGYSESLTLIAEE